MEVLVGVKVIDLWIREYIYIGNYIGIWRFLIDNLDFVVEVKICKIIKIVFFFKGFICNLGNFIFFLFIFNFFIYELVKIKIR